MKTVNVNASTPYKIIIGNGILSELGRYVSDTLGVCRVCIVTDDTVNALYGDTANDALCSAGCQTLRFVFLHGEASKNAENLLKLIDFLAQNRFTRSDIILALGGGVVGDLAGFASAIYLRGIKFVQVPTTLLAAVDSSVGGKTAIDIDAGKNLVGAFHQPSLVVCDYKTLDTLPRETFSDGCAEVIKYAVIGDGEFFQYLKSGIRNNIESIIEKCVKMKASIVEEDEFDNGRRQLLNLGHTAGHAIEVCSKFKISHGSAVAIGMVIASKIAYSQGLCTKEELSEISDLLIAEGLPTLCPFSATELAEIASADKKRLGDSISFIIPCGIGNCKPIKIKLDELEEFIKKGL